MKKILYSGLLLFFLLAVMVFSPYSPYSPLPSAMDTTDSVITELNEMNAAFPLAFGGRIIFTTVCNCNVPPGLRLQVGPPRPIDILYQPGISTLFSFYSLLPSEYILGTYVAGGVCLVGITPACVGTPTLGTIVIAGTSLIPR